MTPSKTEPPRPGRRWHAWAVDLALVVIAGLDALLNFPPPRDWHFLVSLAAALVLLLRRRFPRAVLVAALPGLYAGSALLAAMTAAYTVAGTRRPRWQKALVTLAVILYSARAGPGE